MKKPTVDILKNRKTGIFLLMHYALSRKMGWNAAWGGLSPYSRDEFGKLGLAAVMKSLREFDTRDGDDESKLRYTPKKEDQLSFTREHLSLGVRYEGASLLILTPHHRKGGGYVGQDHIEIKLPCSAADFLAKVEAAFAKCS